MAEDVLPQEHSDDRPDRRSARRKSRGASPGWPDARSSRWKLRNTPRVGYVGPRTSNPWCAIWWRRPSTWWREEKNSTKFAERAEQAAEERVLDLLLPGLGLSLPRRPDGHDSDPKPNRIGVIRPTAPAKSFARSFGTASLDHRLVEVEVRERSVPAVFEIIFKTRVSRKWTVNIKDNALGAVWASRRKRRRMTVAEAFDYLIQEEEKQTDRIMDPGDASGRGGRAEQNGHHFQSMRSTKIAGTRVRPWPGCFRAKGVQRDILPIVEGTTVNTRYGMIRTRSCSLHRRRRFSHITKPSGPDSRTSRALADPALS